MSSEEEKYEEILKFLRESKPVMKSRDEIEENILERILKQEKKDVGSANILDFLFGWTYIGWVRRSLIAASVLIITIFTYQQSLILKRINSLENRTISSESHFVNGSSYNIDQKMLLYKLAGWKISPQPIISEKQMELLMNSFNDLKVQYEDLVKVINEDPELKNIIENRLTEKNKEKLNL